ncbi:peroxidase family protein [Engelhardtia mirabilis]|uniref:Peroxidase n=1 Tax=Engelhardtia mirabilis TaxID=2528011 RepID=A0A518BP12_9BACT|nr:peroxidase [Planctomycetes bacterium Pla133]QDV03049.1 peroxidase [Planctomycetes bacterium Pla86]
MNHGNLSRDITAPRSKFYHGPFGRLFRELPPWVPPGKTDAERERYLRNAASTMFEAAGSSDSFDNSKIPAGYTYFGQFIDHDITFDPTSSLQKQNDPDRLQNFRTPRLDLDNVYGEGPGDEPFMYDRREGRGGEFLLGKGRKLPADLQDSEIAMSELEATGEDDLPRNEQGRALIGDMRNDENLIVSQLQLAFLKLHNKVLRRVKADEGLTGDEAFERTQQVVRWHYQYVVIHDFLRDRVVSKELVDDILPDLDATGPQNANLYFYDWSHQPFIPVEFSVAAYRLGHSMVRPSYQMNAGVSALPIFLPAGAGHDEDLRGFRPLPEGRTADWKTFFEISGSNPQKSRKLDGKLSPALMNLPFDGNSSLAFLNLARGWRMGLPSGQAIARAMALPEDQIIPNSELGIANSGVNEAPLWFYILKEAELQQGGERLGAVGGRIVAEVLIGLILGDPRSYLNIHPRFEPTIGKTMGELLDFAGTSVAP